MQRREQQGVFGAHPIRHVDHDFRPDGGVQGALIDMVDDIPESFHVFSGDIHGLPPSCLIGPTLPKWTVMKTVT
jgi:hypothetical protein